jgi:hypothetical protein
MKFEGSIFIIFALSTCLLSFSAKAVENLWAGRYRDNRGYDLVIDEWEPGQLQVDIVKAGKPVDNPDDEEAAFLAEVNGDIATWSSIQECPISLKRTHSGIVVTDHCGGARNSSGLYKPIR